MQRFVLQNGGLPCQVETHGEVPRIKEIFDHSGSLIILSRTGFTKERKVKIGQEKIL